MSLRNKILPAAAALCLLAVPLAGCSTTPGSATSSTTSSVTSQAAPTQWVAKNDNSTIPSGVYHYYLANAYLSAVNRQRDDYSKPIFDEEIDGVPAEEWIRQQALDGVKNLLLVNDLMKEYNLTVSTDDALLASSQSDSYWNSTVSSIFQPYGVTKEDAKAAQFDFQVKNTTVFEYLYSNGDQEVTDEELIAYLKKNYTACRYVLRSTYSSYASLPDDELKALRDQFNGYQRDIRNGTMTIEDAAQDLAEKDAESYAQTNSSASKPTSSEIKKQAESELQTRILDLSDNDKARYQQLQARYPQEMLDALKEMRNGEVRTIEAQGYLITIVRDNINTAAEDRIADPQGRREILIDWKGTEYAESMKEKIKEYTNFELNDKEVNINLREFFAEESTASSRTASRTSSRTSGT